MENNHKTKKTPIFFLALLNTAGSCIIVLLIFHIGINTAYKNKLYPGTIIANENLSGKSPNEAATILETKRDQANKKNTITANKTKEQPTYEQLGITFDINESIKNAYQNGRSKNITTNIIDQLKTILNKNNPVNFTTDSETLNTYIENKLTIHEKITKEATPTKDNNAKFQSGEAGTRINKNLLLKRIQKSAKNLLPINTPLPLENDFPQITTAEIQNARYQEKQITKNITLTHKNKEWQLTSDNINELIQFSKAKTATQLTRKNLLEEDNFDLNTFVYINLTHKQPQNDVELVAHLNPTKTTVFLNNLLADDIKVEPKNARFILKEDKSIELVEESKKGVDILLEKNIKHIDYALNQKNSPSIEILTRETGAKVTKENASDLGINDLLATGESDFSGSPQARRHNISVGTQKLSGILVPPGEEYSLLSHLGEVTAEAGYLPELVIKPGKTIKEYGGGLCQLGTTIFRGAMNAGLQITERQWHSYPVEYYKPYGTDATIYDPAPDFKFLNNTEGYILVQGEIENNKLVFKYYGTKDNRAVRFEGPHQWDHGWAGPGSLKTKWTQIVTMPNGEEKSKTFYSFYKSPESYH